MAQATQTERALGELLLAGTRPGEEFASFIRAYKNIPHGAPVLMLLEEQPRRVIEQDARQNLLYFAFFDPNFDFTPYTSGRIFHPFGELRWERHLANVRIVYTGHREYKPDLPEVIETPLDGCIPHDRKYFLFGKRLDKVQLNRIGPAAQPGDFAEVRIPRLLRYPQLPILAGAERVQLAICEYVDSETAVNIAYRFKELVPFLK